MQKLRFITLTLIPKHRENELTWKPVAVLPDSPWDSLMKCDMI